MARDIARKRREFEKEKQAAQFLKRGEGKNMMTQSRDKVNDSANSPL